MLPFPGLLTEEEKVQLSTSIMDKLLEVQDVHQKLLSMRKGTKAYEEMSNQMRATAARADLDIAKLHGLDIDKQDDRDTLVLCRIELRKRANEKREQERQRKISVGIGVASSTAPEDVFDHQMRAAGQAVYHHGELD